MKQFSTLAILLCLAAPALAEGDAVAGKTVFKKCAPCHSVEKVNRVGPTLSGIVGRPVATQEEYRAMLGLPERAAVSVTA